MYRALAWVIAFIFWAILVDTTNAAALPPAEEADNPLDHAIELSKEIVHRPLRGFGDNYQKPSNSSIILAQSLINNNGPFIRYKVPHTTTTLDFHNFGSPIPGEEVLQAIASAMGIVFDFISEKKGSTPIANGVFSHTRVFKDGGTVLVTLGDFREIGHPITYSVLCGVIRGLGDFIIMPLQRYQTMHFEIERDKVYVGTGRIGYTPKPTRQGIWL